MSIVYDRIRYGGDSTTGATATRLHDLCVPQTPGLWRIPTHPTGPMINPPRTGLINDRLVTLNTGTDVGRLGETRLYSEAVIRDTTGCPVVIVERDTVELDRLIERESGPMGEKLHIAHRARMSTTDPANIANGWGHVTRYTHNEPIPEGHTLNGYTARFEGHEEGRLYVKEDAGMLVINVRYPGLRDAALCMRMCQNAMLYLAHRPLEPSDGRQLQMSFP